MTRCFTLSIRDDNVTTTLEDQDLANTLGDMPVVFLIGMRGAGKTTLGRALAEKLGWMFAETDDMVAARYGKTVNEIVQAEGWGGFRRKEARLLPDITRPYTVISTGGGTILREENRRFMRAHGICVYLQAPADLLARRLREGTNHRPFLSPSIETLVGADPLRAEIASLLRERDGLYLKVAHRRINASQPLEVSLASLESCIREFIERFKTPAEAAEKDAQ